MQANLHFRDVVDYKSLEDAQHSVVLNENWGLLHFESDFSSALSQRLVAKIGLDHEISEETLNSSDIKLQIDNTNSEVARALTLNVIKSINGFFLDYAKV